MHERREIQLITAGGREKLPQILVRGWRQWQVSPSGLLEIPTPGPDSEWLDPRHTDELWLAQGLALPQAEIGLQFMIKAGEIRCIMPSLTTHLQVGDRSFYNRGLRTLPLAHTWTNFVGLQLGSLVLHAFHRATDDDPWQTWAPQQGPDAALRQLIRIIAEGPAPLQQGFHLVSVPLCSPEQILEPDHQYGLVLAHGTDVASVLDRAESPCACLKITTCRTARLSESFRRPEVYDELIRSEQADG